MKKEIACQFQKAYTLEATGKTDVPAKSISIAIQLKTGLCVSSKMNSNQPATIDPAQIRQKIVNKETFVVNVVTSWCPDCTQKQSPHLPLFIEKLSKHKIPCFQFVVQHERLQFLSQEHESLTLEFGGHGYPRTVLIINGKIQPDSKVEVVTADDLDAMADDFIARTS
ncbi:MAG: hypothetical protein MJE63_02515 [Proteobacteria bacterium]|nr:hypothetical protein [Pseudomonadota bacterium]